MSQMRCGLKTRRYVFRCSLKVVSDSPVSRRLNGSSFHVRGPVYTGSSEGSVTEGAVLTWYMTDASLRSQPTIRAQSSDVTANSHSHPNAEFYVKHPNIGLGYSCLSM